MVLPHRFVVKSLHISVLGDVGIESSSWKTMLCTDQVGYIVASTSFGFTLRFPSIWSMSIGRRLYQI